MDVRRRVGAVAVAVGLVLSGCTELTAGTAISGLEPAGESSGKAPYRAQVCEQLHAEQWIEVPGGGPDEPRVRVAQPPGWVPIPELADDPVRLALRNEGLSDGVTNPAVSVSVADVTDGDKPPEVLLQDSVAGYGSAGGQDVDPEPAEICGFPAMLVSYTISPGRATKTIYVTAVSVMVPLDGGTVWNVLAMAQTTEPNNPTYMADVQVMLAGLRIAMPR